MSDYTPTTDEVRRGYAEVAAKALRAVLDLVPHRYPDADDPERNLGDPVLFREEVVQAIQAALAVNDEGGTT